MPVRKAVGPPNRIHTNNAELYGSLFFNIAVLGDSRKAGSAGLVEGADQRVDELECGRKVVAGEAPRRREVKADDIRIFQCVNRFLGGI